MYKEFRSVVQAPSKGLPRIGAQVCVILELKFQCSHSFFFLIHS